MTLDGETVATGAPILPGVEGPKVMQSAAGYFIGYTIVDEKYGFQEPYSRESCYYQSYEDAVSVLESGKWYR